jgi:hypothetical protein
MFTTLDLAGTAEAIATPVDQSVADSLMLPLAVIVLDVLTDDSPKMAFAERNHLTDAL